MSDKGKTMMLIKWFFQKSIFYLMGKHVNCKIYIYNEKHSKICE